MIQEYCSTDGGCGHRNIFMTEMFTDGGGPIPPPALPPIPEPAITISPISGTQYSVLLPNATLPNMDSVEVEVGNAGFTSIVDSGNATLLGGPTGNWLYDTTLGIPAGTYSVRVRYISGGNPSPWTISSTQIVIS